MTHQPAHLPPVDTRLAVARRHGAALAVALACAGLSALAEAQTGTPAHKVSSEVRLALEARQVPQQPWVRESGGLRVLRVVVTGKGRGADLADVRELILRRGGQVLSHQSETSTAVAVLPAALVHEIARRPDVLHVAADNKPPAGGAVVSVNGITVAAVPGFAPGTESLRARNDLALLGE